MQCEYIKVATKWQYVHKITYVYTFQPPIPVRPWQGEYDATEDGPICPQPWDNYVTGSVSEDCLFLNVYTKKVIINMFKSFIVHFLSKNIVNIMLDRRY